MTKYVAIHLIEELLQWEGGGDEDDLEVYIFDGRSGLDDTMRGKRAAGDWSCQSEWRMLRTVATLTPEPLCTGLLVTKLASIHTETISLK